jgi:CMP-N-acetylneuraminic acid synthetase
MAEDDSPIGMAIDHTLRWFEKRGRQFKYIMLLQPTSPLRTCGHIDDALRSFFSQRRSEEDTLVSVYKAAQKASWLIQEDKDGYGHFCVDHHADRRSRQTLAQLYYPNGAIYMAPTLGFKGEFYGPKAKLYIMDECDSIDIDDKSDFERAKEAHLLREMKKSLDC